MTRNMRFPSYLDKRDERQGRCGQDNHSQGEKAEEREGLPNNLSLPGRLETVRPQHVNADRRCIIEVDVLHVKKDREPNGSRDNSVSCKRGYGEEDNPSEETVVLEVNVVDHEQARVGHDQQCQC